MTDKLTSVFVLGPGTGSRAAVKALERLGKIAIQMPHDCPGGGTAKVIAGTMEVDGVSTIGPIKGVTTIPPTSTSCYPQALASHTLSTVSTSPLS